MITARPRIDPTIAAVTLGPVVVADVAAVVPAAVSSDGVFV